jgi:tRNA-specific 2-thiouridylase
VWTTGRVPGGPVECVAQVRAHGGLAGAVAELDGELLRVRLREPLRGVAPGQAVALYRPDEGGDVVLGSATIRATAPGGGAGDGDTTGGAGVGLATRARAEAG